MMHDGYDGNRNGKRERRVKFSKYGLFSAVVWRMRVLTRNGTDEPISRGQTLSSERGQGVFNFPCSADQSNRSDILSAESDELPPSPAPSNAPNTAFIIRCLYIRTGGPAKGWEVILSATVTLLDVARKAR